MIGRFSRVNILEVAGAAQLTISGRWRVGLRTSATTMSSASRPIDLAYPRGDVEEADQLLSEEVRPADMAVEAGARGS